MSAKEPEGQSVVKGKTFDFSKQARHAVITVLYRVNKSRVILRKDCDDTHAANTAMIHML